MVVTIILDIDGVSYVCRTFENESIQINKLVASIDNLGSQGTITRQSFRLPLIGGLLEAIGDVTDPSQSAKVNLNKSIKGRILVDGFERFFGSFFVVNTTKGDSKEVEMIFQGNETDLKATLSNITMAELCDGETIAYNYTEIQPYFYEPYQYMVNNGYLWPVIDYGDKFTYDDNASVGYVNELFEVNFKPAITLQKLFDLMPINITVNNMQQIMHQCILLHNNKNKIPVLTTSPLDNTGFFLNITDLTLSGNQSATKVTWSAVSLYNQVSAPNWSIQNSRYTAPVSGTYTFSFEGDIDFVYGSATGIARIGYVIETGSTLNSAASLNRIIVYSNTGTTSHNREFSVNLIAGQSIYLQYTSIDVGSATFKTNFYFRLLQAPALNANSLVDVPANCPKLTAWDIFRTVAIQSNAQIISNPDGTYEMTPFVDWIEDNSEVIILDDIIEDGVDVQIKPFSVQGAKSIRLGYKENDDFYSKQYKELKNENFGEKFIENTGTELAKNELKIEVPISTIPSVLVDFSQAVIPKMVDSSGNLIVGKPTILQTNYDVEGTQITNKAFTDFTFTLKSLFNNAVSAIVTNVPFIGNWRFQNGGYDETDNNFGQSLSYWSSVGYPSQNLYERYWKTYLEETYSEQSREIKMNIKLNRNQIDGLKFNEKFYYKNTLLRLVKLEGISLTSNQPATATFMKRFTIFPTDIATYYPYDVINSIVQWKVSADNSSVGDGSGETPTVEASANAYGFFYDSNQDIATQSGQILIT
ncbi:hypothetical protein N9515_09995 [Vicingaceae bacterium]|nr:hypothetical protein [Vicingaceae bacterium]